MRKNRSKILGKETKDDMKKLGLLEQQTIEASKHHRKIEKEKGFVPSPPLLIPEISKLFDLVAKLSMPDGQKMTYTRRAIYRALDKNESLSQQELAAFAHISAPCVSMEISDMEKEGLVVRERNENDRRAWNIYLTDEGKKRSRELKKANDEIAAVIKKDLSHEDEKILSELLIGVRNRLLESLEKMELS